MAIWPLLYFSQKKRFDSRVESDKKSKFIRKLVENKRKVCYNDRWSFLCFGFEKDRDDSGIERGKRSVI